MNHHNWHISDIESTNLNKNCFSSTLASPSLRNKILNFWPDQQDKENKYISSSAQSRNYAQSNRCHHFWHHQHHGWCGEKGWVGRFRSSCLLQSLEKLTPTLLSLHHHHPNHRTLHNEKRSNQPAEVEITNPILVGTVGCWGSGRWKTPPYHVFAQYEEIADHNF